MNIKIIERTVITTDGKWEVNLRIVLDDKKPLKAGDKLQGWSEIISRQVPKEVWKEKKIKSCLGSYNGTEGQAFDEKEVQLEDIATVKSDDPWNKSGFLVIGSVRVKTDSNDDSAYSAIEEKVLLQEGSTNLLGYGVIGGMVLFVAVIGYFLIRWFVKSEETEEEATEEEKEA